MHQIDTDTYRLTSGREVKVNQGIIGLKATGGVYGGYDEVVIDDEGDSWDGRWTPEERRELADYMIARWTRWRDGREG